MKKMFLPNELNSTSHTAMTSTHPSPHAMHRQRLVRPQGQAAARQAGDAREDSERANRAAATARETVQETCPVAEAKAAKVPQRQPLYVRDILASASGSGHISKWLY